MKIKVNKLERSGTYEIDVILDARHYQGRLTIRNKVPFYVPDSPNVTQVMSNEDCSIIAELIENLQ
jgi:hypothetical protein